MKISSVPIAAARPVGNVHRPSYAGPRKRLGVPAAPGHVSLRRIDSDVLVNYGLWTLLAGVVSTLSPLMPIESPAWDAFISYQPWAGIIIAISGVLMMIVYQSGPDFARGPGAPLLVAAFWMVGVTLSVFSGWIAESVREREEAANLAAAAAPTVQQQAPPLPQYEERRQLPASGSESPPPNQSRPPDSEPSRPANEPSKPEASPPRSNPFGIPTEEAAPGGTPLKKFDGNRDLASIKRDLDGASKRDLLQALSDVQWYYTRAERDLVENKLVKLLSHPDDDVLAAALKALKTWGSDAIIEPVIPFAAHDSALVRVEAIALLGQFRSPAGLAALVERLEADTEDAKVALMRAGKGGEAALRKGLKSKSKAIKLECLRILDKLSAVGSYREIRAMAVHEKDAEVKAEAKRVADSLATKK